MPLSTTSIIDPGEVDSRVPLKKSTMAWAMLGLVLLAVIGILSPRLLRDPEVGVPARKDKPVNVGQTRQIEGEFDDAQRRVRFQSTPPAVVTSAATAPLPSGTIAAVLPGVVPPSARRDQNSAVLYGRQLDAAGTAAGVEIEAAARNSASVRHDFGEPSSTATGQVAEQVAARLRSMLPEPAASAAASPAGALPDRLAAMLEAQRRRPEGASTGRAADRTWLQELGDTPRQQALRPATLATPLTLLQGKVLPAVLGRDLNTDLPGEVTAFTTEDVYDSLSSRHLLIPKGSMLTGRYSNAVRSGQERILFAFSRITLPNGTGIDLPGFSGADAGGAAGVEGAVNNHFFKQFASSVLVALLANRVERDRVGPTVVAGGNQGGAVSAAGQVLVDVSRSILERNKGIEPTITVGKGTLVLVEVARDIEFPSAYRRP